MLPDRVSNPGPLTYESGALLGMKYFLLKFVIFGKGLIVTSGINDGFYHPTSVIPICLPVQSTAQVDCTGGEIGMTPAILVCRSIPI